MGMKNKRKEGSDGWWNYTVEKIWPTPSSPVHCMQFNHDAWTHTTLDERLKLEGTLINFQTKSRWAAERRYSPVRSFIIWTKADSTVGGSGGPRCWHWDWNLWKLSPERQPPLGEGLVDRRDQNRLFWWSTSLFCLQKTKNTVHTVIYQGGSQDVVVSGTWLNENRTSIHSLSELCIFTRVSGVLRPLETQLSSLRLRSRVFQQDNHPIIPQKAPRTKCWSVLPSIWLPYEHLCGEISKQLQDGNRRVFKNVFIYGFRKSLSATVPWGSQSLLSFLNWYT